MRVFWKVQGVPERRGADRAARKALDKLTGITGYAPEKIVNGEFGVTVHYRFSSPKEMRRQQLEVVLRSAFSNNAIRVTEDTQ